MIYLDKSVQVCIQFRIRRETVSDVVASYHKSQSALLQMAPLPHVGDTDHTRHSVKLESSFGLPMH